MLIVIGVIGLLGGMLSVVIIKARNKSIQIECSENLHNIGTTINAVMLAAGGAYPSLYTDADGDAVDLTGAAKWDGTNGIPWWARVFKEWEGGAKLDARDPYHHTGNPADKTPDELDLPRQVPGGMKAFHCRMAPALHQPVAGDSNAENVRELDQSISYGLNFDMKDSDDCDYHDTNHVSPYSVRFPASLTAADKQPDVFRFPQIRSPAEFILISEANAGNDPNVDEPGGRIACVDSHEDSSDTGKSTAPVVGRHGGRANVLFADGHVGLMESETYVELTHEPWENKRGSANSVNKNTPPWTLPDD